MSKKINRALLQDILSQGDGVNSVASEAVDWCIAAAESAAANLAKSGRRTPSGRLMAPKFAPSLMARQAALPPEPALGEGDCVTQEETRPLPERLCSRAKETLAANGGERPGVPDDAEDYSDWRYEVANGDTRLGFDEWKAHKKEANNVPKPS